MTVQFPEFWSKNTKTDKRKAAFNFTLCYLRVCIHYLNYLSTKWRQIKKKF